MRRHEYGSVFTLGVALVSVQSTIHNQSAIRHPQSAMRSPNGLLTLEVQRGDDRRLRYTVRMGSHTVIEPSGLGIVVDGVNLAEGAEAGRGEPYRVDEQYPWLGVHATAVNRCEGMRIPMTHAATKTSWTVDARACDDGVAFRYVVPGVPGAVRIPDEATTFRLPAGSIVWSHDFEGHYEGVHARREVADIGRGDWAATPVTVKLPGGAGYAALSESAVADYAGMALRGDGKGGFDARLGHEEPISYPFFLRYFPDDIARLAQPARVNGPIVTPWRVVMAGRTLNDLVNGDIVHNLAPPPDPRLFPDGVKTAWIRPGRAVWRYLDEGENTFDGSNRFSALAGDLGFEHHVVEGIWQRWTDAQLRELVASARQRHVGIWLWKDSRALATPAEQRAFFDKCRNLGVAGAKIDFFDHEGKEMIDRYQSILREAAGHRIMVNFHGANKPAGESRTWPNELTREAVQGLEHRSMPEWSRHNTTLPFTRFLAGAADYTPIVFGERRKETSWAHQIATAAVFTSPLLVYGAHPESLLKNPAVELIKSLPSVWDKTVVLPQSDIGELAAFARQRGDTWFLAVLNGPAAKPLRVDLGFLGSGRYGALFARDRAADAAALQMDRSIVVRSDSVTMELRSAGGFLGRFVPVKDD